jgi:hypothetical protein
MTEQYSFSIDVPVRNEWSNVSLIVTSVQNCFNAMFADVDGSHAIAMISGELLENAIKYGSWSGDGRAFRLHISGSAGLAEIVVENPVAEMDRATELLATLAKLSAYPSAAEAYRAKLLEVAERPDDPAISKLGLARVAYEGNCQLKASVDGGFVRVVASVDLTR